MFYDYMLNTLRHNSVKIDNRESSSSDKLQRGNKNNKLRGTRIESHYFQTTLSRNWIGKPSNYVFSMFQKNIASL